MRLHLSQNFSVSWHYEVLFTQGVFHEDNPLLAETIAAGSPLSTKKGAPGPSIQSAGSSAGKRVSESAEPDPSTRIDIAPPRRIPNVLFVVDQGLADAHPGLAEQLEAYACRHKTHMNMVGEPIVIPGGEEAKNDPVHLNNLLQAIHTHGIDRHSYLVVAGGGAVIDTAGYAAAIAHRGVRLIRIPTTVLAQNDAAVGVKNGVNAFGKKNFLGTFAPPVAVINDALFLQSLSDRDWRSGISEAVKVALLKDPAFFEYLCDQCNALAARDPEPMHYLVVRCAELHLQHIATSGDPFEMGSSRPLDFGHWAAHKLEQLTRFELRHGEAVAVGIALECTYAMLEGRLDRTVWSRIVQLCLDLGFGLRVDGLRSYLHDADHPESLLHGLREFQEHLGGELTLLLLEDIGRGVEVHWVDYALYREAVDALWVFREGTPEAPSTGNQT